MEIEIFLINRNIEKCSLKVVKNWHKILEKEDFRQINGVMYGITYHEINIKSLILE